MVITISQYKDPPKSISIMECHKGFERCSIVNRDKHNLPFWGHTFLFVDFAGDSATSQWHQTAGANFGKLRGFDGKEFWDSKLSQPLKIESPPPKKNMWIGIGTLLVGDVKKGNIEYVHLFFVSTCFSQHFEVYSWCSSKQQPFDHTLSTMTRTGFLHGVHGYSFSHDHGLPNNNY